MESLMNWFEALSPSLQIFWGISLVSSIIFSFQLLMTLLGFDSGADTEVSDLDLDGEFSLFSLRSIIAFLLFFGWTGVMILERGGSVTRAITLGGIAGTIAMIIIAYLLFQMYKMEESGTVSLQSAIGQHGEVYIPIPSNLNGKGKIQIEVENKLMELTAVTNHNKLSTGKKVKVLDVLDKNILLVEAL